MRTVKSAVIARPLIELASRSADSCTAGQTSRPVAGISQRHGSHRVYLLMTTIDQIERLCEGLTEREIDAVLADLREIGEILLPVSKRDLPLIVPRPSTHQRETK